MKKSLLIATLFLASTFSFNGFAEEKEEKEEKDVTVRELVIEGGKTVACFAMLVGYYKLCTYMTSKEVMTNTKKESSTEESSPANKPVLAPVENVTTTPSAFDQATPEVTKLVPAFIFADQAKNFLKKLKAFGVQKTKPVASAALEAVKNTAINA